ncbi:hypothetical protein RND81_11G162500 [Saponaria officinalis]|uniref:Uncharacterized protein n=1 Tax=Saponaria officinalis TaxID=3572 RepID=A0AAW1HLW5_SAPOF
MLKQPPLLLLILLLNLSLSTTPTTSLTLLTDIAALESLKSLITPSTIPPSSCLSSWNFSHDPCSLPKTTYFICGITCSPDSTRLVSLTLDSVGYSGTLTPLISQLTQLTTLDLGQNSFVGPIPPSLSSLSLLKTLSIRYNYLSGPLPNSITTLSALETLDVSGNSLSGPLPKTFSSLKRLTYLDFSFNNFSGELPTLPPNLLSLAGKSNFLSGPISELAFSGSAQLETVELSSNKFNGLLPFWFFQLPQLQQINLSNNSLTRVEIWKPNKISNNLIAVDLGYNKIDWGISVNLSYYPNLASLSLRYNRLRGPITLKYNKKSKLKRLFLDGNYLNGSPPEEFFSGERGEETVAGSFGDNCLRWCPRSSELCLPSQKPMSVCKQAYGGKRSNFN